MNQNYMYLFKLQAYIQRLLQINNTLSASLLGVYLDTPETDLYPYAVISLGKVESWPVYHMHGYKAHYAIHLYVDKTQISTLHTMVAAVRIELKSCTFGWEDTSLKALRYQGCYFTEKPKQHRYQAVVSFQAYINEAEK